MTRTAGRQSLDKGSTMRRVGWMLSQLVTRMVAARTPALGHEIEEHLERHRYDLPPAVRIELERRHWADTRIGWP